MPDRSLPGGPGDQDPVPRRREIGQARHHQGRAEAEGDGDRFPYGFGGHFYLLRVTDRFGVPEGGGSYWEWVCSCNTKSDRQYRTKNAALKAGQAHSLGKGPVSAAPRIPERPEIGREAFEGIDDRRDRNRPSEPGPGLTEAAAGRFRAFDAEPTNPEPPSQDAWENVKRRREERRRRRREKRRRRPR